MSTDQDVFAHFSLMLSDKLLQAGLKLLTAAKDLGIRSNMRGESHVACPT